jgi:predicted alpha/beta superfamily hydrolase
MIKETLTLGTRSITVLATDFCPDYPLVYTHLSMDTAEVVASLLSDIKFVLAAIDRVDWNAELSPWPARRAFRGEPDFTGAANTYLSELIRQIIPAVEALTGYAPDCRAIVGYSMAGLFAVYSQYHTDQFRRIASVSGSLWYDDFLNYMKEHSPMRLPERFYLSLGSREGQVKNQRLAGVEHCTAEAERLMQALGSKTIFELNPGNHFTEVPERIARGIRWLLEQ